MNKDVAGAPRRSRLTLLAVAAVFVLPIVLAWWMVAVRPPILSDELLNHGRLLQPPIAVGAHPALSALGTIPLTAGEWAVVVVAAASCRDACEAALGRLLDVRTVIGQSATRIRVVLLADGPPSSRPGVVIVDSPEALRGLNEQLAARTPPIVEPGILFLDWRGQIVMQFPLDAAPDSIKSDLKRLLKASKVR